MEICTVGYMERNDKVLVLLRNKKEDDLNEGKIVGPGGHVEEGETPEEGIIREIKEETGINAKNPKLKAIIEYPKIYKNRDLKVYFYYITDFEGEVIHDQEKNEGTLMWVHKDKLWDHNLWEGDRIVVDHVLHGEDVKQGTFVYKDQKLENYVFE